MSRLGNLIHLILSAAFVLSGVGFVLSAQDMPRLASLDPPDAAMLSLAPVSDAPLPGAAIEGLSLPQIFLDPNNLVMWALLLSIWAALMLDALGEWLEVDQTTGPHPRQPLRQTAGPDVRWPLAAGLAFGTIWPWLIDAAQLVAAVGAALAAAALYLATVRAAGLRRPAIGFLAGWSLCLATVMLASQVGNWLDMSLAQAAILAILPAAGFGIAGQLRLGRRIGFSVALIWAFCGLALTTMGVSPMTAIAAILGIAAMATVLIRAAS